MGAIFTVLSEILKHLPKAREARLSGVPEMSDFARHSHAADLAFPRLVKASEPDAEGLELYESYRRHTIEILVSAGLENQLVLLFLKVMDEKKVGESLTCSPEARWPCCARRRRLRHQPAGGSRPTPSSWATG